MTIMLGIDIGTNSVGSAWIDTRKKEIHLGVSVFPAGVEESDNKRGAPKNQSRRNKRSQRRSIRRRSRRKARLRQTLIQSGLLPSCTEELRKIFGPQNQNEKLDLEKYNPWHLRREGLIRQLTPHEFGRVLVHLNQRRGSLGVEFKEDDNDDDTGPIKRAYNNLKKAILHRYVHDAEYREQLEQDEEIYQEWLHKENVTLGRFLADEYDERKTRRVNSNDENFDYRSPVRNLRDMLLENDGRAFHADRALILDEYNRVWERQKSFDSPLSKLLTNELKKKLCNPEKDETWKVKGDIFGQRNTYWDTSTLGRCDLEPTDHQCPIGDMWAQEFRVLETVNRIKVEMQGKAPRPLSSEERLKVIDILSKQKTATCKTIRKALGFNKKEVKNQVVLNIEREQRIDINTNWFASRVIAAFGEDAWNQLPKSTQKSVNRAFLRLDSAENLREGAIKWWKVDKSTTDLLVDAWKSRPNTSKRLNLSRKAIKNLLPYMRGEYDGRFMGVSEARQAFAEDAGNGASELQRDRYSLNGSVLTASDRRYLSKHTNSLPPAPMLSNPVVRKTIHEVRRHVNTYLRKFGGIPDRVVVELAREAKTPAKLRNQQLSANRYREKETKNIIEEFKLADFSKNQQYRAVQRVKLCIEQKLQCAYCNNTITPLIAANGQTDQGERIEIDHIIPMSRSQDNGFNNKVLCHSRCNRDKGNRTPKEWLSEEEFKQMKQRLRHLGNAKSRSRVKGYDCKGNPSKWKKLNLDVHSTDEEQEMDKWRNSQLNDTSYAARQVMAYLRDVLYGGEAEGQRHVFASNGKYTAILRRDWGLVEGKLDEKWHAWKLAENDEKGAAKKSEKDRSDHRHHAIDAIAIALCPNYINKIAKLAAKWEKYKAGIGTRPTVDGQEPPWGSKQKGEFRRQVLNAIDDLVVSHRPQNRRIVGALHKETAYGIAKEYPGLYTERVRIDKLKPAHFKEPEPVYKGERILRWKIPGKGQGRAIRDPQFRNELKVCLKANGLDPEKFSENELKKLIDFSNPDKHLIRLKSGVPIYSITMLLALSDPICIQGSDGVQRYFVGGNNHHMEILEDDSGRWFGKTITMFDVAQRNILRLRKQSEVGIPTADQLRSIHKKDRHKYRDKVSKINKEFPIVDRTDRNHGQFVMSLAIGEVVYLKHKKTKKPEYFVVHKLDGKKAYFHPHWDARRASGENKREQIELSASQIQELIVDENMMKVSIDPLGRARALPND